MVTESKWHTLLNDYTSAGISDATAVRWWRELTDGPSAINTNNEELCEAIRRHAEDPNAKTYGKPTLRDLRIMVFSLRKSKSMHGDVDRSDSEVFVSNLKNQVERAMANGDQGHAWDVMCAPDRFASMDREPSLDECYAVNEWASERWPGKWRRPFGQAEVLDAASGAARSAGATNQYRRKEVEEFTV